MKIGLTYDLRTEYLSLGYTEEETAEFDNTETIRYRNGPACTGLRNRAHWQLTVTHDASAGRKQVGPCFQHL